MDRGGGISLNISHIHVPPHWVRYLGLVGLKTSINFAHFGLESGMVFKGTTGAYERILSFQFQMNKNEIEICDFEMHLENCFVSTLLVSNDEKNFA